MVKFLDIQKDGDHNRSVITVVGEPDPLKEAVILAVGKAIQLIDMSVHRGQHPRMGAVDVIPFIPIRNVTMDDAIELSKETAKMVWETYKLPVFLMKHQLHARRGRIWQISEKDSLKAWQKR